MANSVGYHLPKTGGLELIATARLILLFLLPGLASCEPGTPINSEEETVATATFRLDSRPGQPALVDGILYVGSESGVVQAVDAGTREVRWRFQTDGPVFNAPLVVNDLVLVGSNDGQLRALDKVTGKLTWSFQAGDVDWDVRDIFINGVPTVLDGIAYFSSEDFNVYAVDVATGKEKWRHTLGEEPQALRIPVRDRVAYIGAWDGHLYAIDLTSGERVWRSVTDDENRAALSEQVPFVTAVPIVTREHVYFSDWAGNLFCVDRRTGRQVWRFDPGVVNSRHAGSRHFIARYDDIIFYSTVDDRHLYGVDRHSGEAIWQTRTEGTGYGPMPVADGYGLVMEFIRIDGQDRPTMRMRMLDFATRRFLWTADDAVSPPNAVDGIVYYGSADGTIRGRRVESGNVVYDSAPN